MAEVKQKQPFEILDYDLNFSRDLDGDTIASVSAAYTGPDDGLEMEARTVDYDDEVIKVITAYGTDKKRYKITVYVVTTGGRVIESEFILAIKDT